jgi:uncharacterized membrane protein YeaQ/YmgE (transglycosylase-associated protein family)
VEEHDCEGGGERLSIVVLIIVGLVAGILAELAIPGPGGIVVTVLIWIVGSFVGGFVTQRILGLGRFCMAYPGGDCRSHCSPGYVPVDHVPDGVVDAGASSGRWQAGRFPFRERSIEA